MRPEETIPAREFCLHHSIEAAFIYSLNDHGLVELIVQGNELFVPLDQLPFLEKLVRMYYEMDINLEGIETIIYLLQREKDMQQEITRLRNRLLIYEG